jgi:DNA repair exonuclease SbcCD ATPase subunit
MIPKRIYIENFMSHSKTEIDCTKFKSCLIVGRSKNNDRESNGTGKSTIFKAINYVLFGDVPTKTLDKAVREGQDKCIVEFDFELDGVDYRVSRKRSVKSNKSEFILKFWNGTKWEKSDHRTSSATEKAAQEMIKINFDAFRNSVLFEQGSFSEIAQGTDTQRRKILKEPLHLGIYTNFEKAAKAKYNKIDKELNKVKTLIENIGEPKQDIANLTEDFKNLSLKIDLLDKDRKAIRYDLTVLRQDVSDQEKLLSSDAAKIADKLVEIDSKKQQIQIQINQLGNKAATYKKELDSKNKEVIDKESELLSKRKDLDSIIETKIRTDKEVAEEIALLDEKEEKGNKWVASLEVDYDRLSKPLPVGAQCTECFNELTEDYRHKVSSDNKKKVKKVQSDLSSAKNKLSKLKNKRKNLYDEVKLIAQRQRKTESLNDQITNINNQITSAKEYINKIKALATELLEDVDNKEKTIKQLEKDEKSLKDSSKDFSITKINAKIVSLQSEIREKEIKENNIIRDISSNSTLVGITEEKKHKRENDLIELDRLSKEKIELDYKLLINSRVVKAFSSSGIPTLIIHTILDDLQVEANKVLQDIRPDISLSFSIEKEQKDVLDISYKINGRDRDYSQLSGGQKTFVAFALKFGLSLVIQKRLGVDIKFLELDEVDQPLDQAGQDAFVDIIRKYQDKFKIFVVTHNDRLKDKFNHAILVEHDGDNGATGTLVNQW